VTEDPFGNAFDAGIWDGQRVAINTTDNLPGPYLDDPTWQVITFHIAGGAQAVGFSLENVDTDVQLVANGVPQGGVLTLSGLPAGDGRQGYVKVTATGGDAPITSIGLDNTQSGSSVDGYAFDHFAIDFGLVVPSLSPLGLAVLGLGLLLAAGGRVFLTAATGR
jgi:hypothetical protein